MPCQFDVCALAGRKQLRVLLRILCDVRNGDSVGIDTCGQIPFECSVYRVMMVMMMMMTHLYECPAGGAHPALQAVWDDGFEAKGQEGEGHLGFNIDYIFMIDKFYFSCNVQCCQEWATLEGGTIRTGAMHGLFLAKRSAGARSLTCTLAMIMMLHIIYGLYSNMCLHGKRYWTGVRKSWSSSR